MTATEFLLDLDPNQRHADHRIVRCESLDEMLETAARLMPGVTLQLADDGRTITGRPA